MPRRRNKAHKTSQAHGSGGWVCKKFGNGIRIYFVCFRVAWREHAIALYYCSFTHSQTTTNSSTARLPYSHRGFHTRQQSSNGKPISWILTAAVSTAVAAIVSTAVASIVSTVVAAIVSVAVFITTGPSPGGVRSLFPTAPSQRGAVAPTPSPTIWLIRWSLWFNARLAHQVSDTVYCYFHFTTTTIFSANNLSIYCSGAINDTGAIWKITTSAGTHR